MPFQHLYGRLPNLPGYLQKDPKGIHYAYDSYVRELESRLQSSYAVVKRNLETAKLDNKRLYDQHTHLPKFKVGSFVLVKDESVRRGRSKKLEAAYVGPYKFVRIEGSNLVLCTKRSEEMKVHANRVKPIFA
jgi:hypothetical protein